MDTVRLLGMDSTQLIIANTTFAQINTMSADMKYDPADGILGLGQQALGFGNIPSPLTNAINQNLLKEPIFTVWLDSEGTNFTNKRGGFVHLWRSRHYKLWTSD
uniref:Peptidase A1 domain-containing protein n=1 Tax=Ditylenchus dipsaci TaxID=166011 RepID=A0A915END9_9BILA